MAKAISKDTGAERMSIRVDNVTSRGRFSRGSFAFGTRIAWIGLGDLDKLTEDVYGSSMNANSYLTVERQTEKLNMFFN